MKFHRIALMLGVIPILHAADLTGHWVGQMPPPPAGAQAPGGGPRQFSLWLQSNGAVLTGYISNPQGNTPIADGRINGDHVAFAVVREFLGETRRIVYNGTLTDQGLRLHLPSRGGADTERFVLLTRVSTDPPKPFLPPPPKISLPPAPDVPYNGLAKTPPMGWNSWNRFRREVSDALVRETADAMVRTGMRDAGYVYVNIDDTWEGTRDAQGNIQTNDRFPDMKALAAYVHGKGLKLGIYSSPGPKTCAGFEGSFGHESQDARTWAAWGIDYIKYDWCSASQVYENSSMPAVYAKMGQALLSTGRPIVYSVCQYGVLNVGDWAARSGGNLWRTTGDIRDQWLSMSDIGFERQIGREKYAGPGHWNDPDMLEIGNGGMSDAEYRTHMSLWSLLAAPLLAGNDLRNMSPEIQAILTNKEVIAVDQDPLGQQGKRIAKDGMLEVWARPLAQGALAVGLFNRGPSFATVTARRADLGIDGAWTIRDLWAHTDRGRLQQEFAAEVPSHGVILLKLTRSR